MCVFTDVGTAMVAFRRHVMRGFGLDPLAKPRAHSIAVIAKGRGTSGAITKRVAVNLVDALAHVQAVFPNVGVTYVSPNMSHVDQIRAISQASVVLGGNGGSSFGAIFAAEGAPAIFFDCVVDKTGKTGRFKNEFKMWRNLLTMRDMYYPVLRKELLRYKADPRDQHKVCNSPFRLDPCRLAHLMLFALESASASFSLPFLPTDAHFERC